MDIDTDLDQQLENLQRRNKVAETKLNDLEALKEFPEKIRGKYDQYWDMIEDRKKYVDISQEELNKNLDLLQKQQETTKKNMDILQEQQKIIDNINIIYDKMIEILNRNKKGTLQGRMRQTIRQTIAENNMLPNEDDEIAKNVLEQDYDEHEHMERDRNNNIGGKKRRRKTKTHKKIKNKNKKSRRFMRNK